MNENDNDFQNIIDILSKPKKETSKQDNNKGFFTQADIDNMMNGQVIITNNKQDKLTGLPNAEQFKEDFAHALKEAENELFDITIIVTDIDEFKKVNDSFGHQEGDNIIRKMGETLNKLECPHQVYRYSGDSFTVICPRTEKETVFLLMEGIRKIFADNELCKKVSVTMSAGIATYPEDGTNETEIMRKADGALYRAKTSGRNKISIAKEEKLVTKTAHYTVEQLKKLKDLSEESSIGEAALMREALDELFKKYDQKKKADKPTVLIIDDAAFMRMMVKDIVEKNGFEVVAEAVDGLDGLEKFDKYNPDFTILDIAMQNLDGLSCLKRIKKKEKNKIIMLTAMGNLSYFLDSIKSGADAFIVKPFQADRLIDVMKNIKEYKINPEYMDEIARIINDQKTDSNRALSQSEIDALIIKIREQII